MGNSNETLLNCLELHHKQRIPFHWTDKTKDFTVKFFMQGGQSESSHFTLADGGSLFVTNVDRSGKVHFFRVTKRLVLNSTFIVIEEREHSPYKIDNLSSHVGISYG